MMTVMSPTLRLDPCADYDTAEDIPAIFIRPGHKPVIHHGIFGRLGKRICKSFG